MDRLANVQRMNKLAEEWRAKAKEPKMPEPEPEKAMDEKPKKRKAKEEVVKDSEEK